MSELNFDASQVEPDTGTGDPIPAGWYNAMVDESEVKPTKDGLGARLAVRFTVLDGQYVNRKVFTGFNIRNANPVAQEIAFKQLSALAHAVNVLNVKKSEMLHGIPLKIRVKVKAASGDYEASNDITAFKNINENVATVGGAANTALPAAPAGFAGTTAAPAAPVAATAAPAAATGWQAPAAQQPWQQPTTAAPESTPPAFTPPPAPPAPPEAPFPPEGWVAHPSAAGYFYKGQEVLTEADLRAKYAVPLAPTVPPVPPSPPAVDPSAAAATATPPWQQPKA